MKRPAVTKGNMAIARGPTPTLIRIGMLSLAGVLMSAACVYDSTKRCNENQVIDRIYKSDTCNCAPGYVPDGNVCVPCGVNETTSAQSVCVCKAGYGRASTGAPCLPCEANEVLSGETCSCMPGYARAGGDGSCIQCGSNETAGPSGCTCQSGFARATPEAACTAQAQSDAGSDSGAAGLGAPCSSAIPCADAVYSHCAATPSGGYCTKPGCTAAGGCDAGYYCDVAATPSFCRRNPTGQGSTCATAADCAAFDANFCETTVSKTCLVQGCSLTPDNCTPDYKCQDFTSWGMPLICTSRALIAAGGGGQ